MTLRAVLVRTLVPGRSNHAGLIDPPGWELGDGPITAVPCLDRQRNWSEVQMAAADRDNNNIIIYNNI